LNLLQSPIHRPYKNRKGHRLWPYPRHSQAATSSPHAQHNNNHPRAANQLGRYPKTATASSIHCSRTCRPHRPGSGVVHDHNHKRQRLQTSLSRQTLQTLTRCGLPKRHSAALPLHEDRRNAATHASVLQAATSRHAVAMAPTWRPTNPTPPVGSSNPTVPNHRPPNLGEHP